jgi:hypothetical protein
MSQLLNIKSIQNEIKSIYGDVKKKSWEQLEQTKKDLLITLVNHILSRNFFIIPEDIENDSLPTKKDDGDDDEDEDEGSNWNIVDTSSHHKVNFVTDLNYTKKQIDDHIADLINGKIIQLVKPYISYIALTRDFLSIFNDDYNELKRIYKKNVVKKNTKDVGVMIYLDALLAQGLNGGGQCIKELKNFGENLLYYSNTIYENVEETTREIITSLIKSTTDTIKNTTDATIESCTTLRMLLGKVIPSGVTLPLSFGGGNMSVQQVGGKGEEVYQAKLVALLKDVLKIFKEDSNPYMYIDLVLTILNDEFAIKEHIASRLLGFIFYFCEFMLVINYPDLDKAFEELKTQINTSEEEVPDNVRLINAKTELQKLQTLIKNLEENKWETELGGGQKTKHRRRNKRKTKRKRKRKIN